MPGSGGAADPVSGLLADEHAVGPLDGCRRGRAGRGDVPGMPRRPVAARGVLAPAVAVAVPGSVVVAIAVRGVRGRGRGVVRRHHDLMPGEPLGEPYLLRVYAPGHGYDTAGDPCGPEAEERRGNGLADVSCRERSCEHGNPLVTVERGIATDFIETPDRTK